MQLAPQGIHHVTAIAGDPQQNVDFYHSVLGLRLIKRTVNFDAPDTYHLYYGDEVGHPGTVLTFFPWPGAPRGRRGTGQTTTTSFSIPETSLGWWRQRIESKGVTVVSATTRLDSDVLAFEDPDGLLIELVASPAADPRPPWESGPVAQEHAVRGFHSVTLTESSLDATAELLDTMHFRVAEEGPDRVRFAAADGAPGSLVDVVPDLRAPRGLVAAGTVHHVAYRAPDDATQLDWRQQILDRGLHVTEVLDRQYFRSIYFREPGGVLFEIATDGPGFTKDETVEGLGEGLKLPPWLEGDRSRIEAALPALKVDGHV